LTGLTDNTWADALSKLANTRQKGKYKSLLQQTLMAPSTTNVCQNLYNNNDEWMSPYVDYLKTGHHPSKVDKG